jgi:hypothetical protein
MEEQSIRLQTGFDMRLDAIMQVIPFCFQISPREKSASEKNYRPLSGRVL